VSLDQAGLDRIWAGWKLATFGSGVGADGRPHLDPPRPDGLSLFEALERSGLPDDRTYIVWRGERTFCIVNVFPYTSGHVMVLPRRKVATLDGLDAATFRDLWRTVLAASSAVKDAFRPEGLNVGLNEGTAGGGSEPDHLHVHVVPRWNADTNFMTSVAETRVLPMTLTDTWLRLREAWPESLPFGP
jgi:ATP adenylyltransferase